MSCPLTLERKNGPSRGIVCSMVVALGVSEQMWLPFDVTRACNVHEFARRRGYKVKTWTTVKGGIKRIRIKRVA